MNMRQRYNNSGNNVATIGSIGNSNNQDFVIEEGHDESALAGASLSAASAPSASVSAYLTPSVVSPDPFQKDKARGRSCRRCISMDNRCLLWIKRLVLILILIVITSIPSIIHVNKIDIQKKETRSEEFLRLFHLLLDDDEKRIENQNSKKTCIKQKEMIKKVIQIEIPVERYEIIKEEEEEVKPVEETTTEATKEVKSETKSNTNTNGNGNSNNPEEDDEFFSAFSLNVKPINVDSQQQQQQQQEQHQDQNSQKRVLEAPKKEKISIKKIEEIKMKEVEVAVETEKETCNNFKPKLAVIIAFPDSQINELSFGLHHWGQDTAYPCDKINIYKREVAKKTNKDERPGLILYAADEDTEQKARSALEKWVNKQRNNKRSALSCFSEVRFMNAHMSTEENTFKYRGLHFLKLFNEPTLWGERSCNIASDLKTSNMIYQKQKDDDIDDSHYTHAFWMEPDTFPIRSGWLNKLEEEVAKMNSVGSWNHGTVQWHDRKMYGMIDRLHVNGNSFYDMRSRAFRLLYINRVVTKDTKEDIISDYMIFDAFFGQPRIRNYIFSLGSIFGFEDDSEYNDISDDPILKPISSLIPVQARTIYGKQVGLIEFIQGKLTHSDIIANHPTDLCMPDIESFRNRHRHTYLVHGWAYSSLVRGSKCCNLFPENEFSFKRAGFDQITPQYQCLRDDLAKK